MQVTELELKRDKFPTGHQCMVDSHNLFCVSFLGPVHMEVGDPR